MKRNAATIMLKSVVPVVTDVNTGRRRISKESFLHLAQVVIALGLVFDFSIDVEPEVLAGSFLALFALANNLKRHRENDEDWGQIPSGVIDGGQDSSGSP